MEVAAVLSSPVPIPNGCDLNAFHLNILDFFGDNVLHRLHCRLKFPVDLFIGILEFIGVDNLTTVFIRNYFGKRNLTELQLVEMKSEVKKLAVNFRSLANEDKEKVACENFYGSISRYSNVAPDLVHFGKKKFSYVDDIGDALLTLIFSLKTETVKRLCKVAVEEGIPSLHNRKWRYLPLYQIRVKDYRFEFRNDPDALANAIESDLSAERDKFYREVVMHDFLQRSQFLVPVFASELHEMMLVYTRDGSTASFRQNSLDRVSVHSLYSKR